MNHGRQGRGRYLYAKSETSFVCLRQVHVISVRRKGTAAATLEIDASAKASNTRLVLVLDADAHVKWTIRAAGAAAEPHLQHSVVVTHFDVSPSGARIEAPLELIT